MKFLRQVQTGIDSFVGPYFPLQAGYELIETPQQPLWTSSTIIPEPPKCSYCGMSHSTDGRCTSCGAPVSRPVILPKSYPCY